MRLDDINFGGRVQFSLSRLLVSLTLFSLAFGAIRWALWEIHHYGGGLFPALLVVAGFLIFVAGVGFLFRKAGEFVLRALGWLLEFVQFWH